MTTNHSFPVEPVEAPTSDEKEILLETARAAQVAGTFPSDSAIRLLTDDYGWNESERRHCMAAARLALAYWGHAWGCLTTNHPALAPPAKGQAEDLAVLRQQAVPVSVRERLPNLSPQGGDFNDAGLLWWFTPKLGWRMCSRDAVDCIPYPTHWLPFHALPLPAGEVEA